MNVCKVNGKLGTTRATGGQMPKAQRRTQAERSSEMRQRLIAAADRRHARRTRARTNHRGRGMPPRRRDARRLSSSLSRSRSTARRRHGRHLPEQHFLRRPPAQRNLPRGLDRSRVEQVAAAAIQGGHRSLASRAQSSRIEPPVFSPEIDKYTRIFAVGGDKLPWRRACGRSTASASKPCSASHSAVRRWPPAAKGAAARRSGSRPPEGDGD